MYATNLFLLTNKRKGTLYVDGDWVSYEDTIARLLPFGGMEDYEVPLFTQQEGSVMIKEQTDGSIKLGHLQLVPVTIPKGVLEKQCAYYPDSIPHKLALKVIRVYFLS